MHEVAQRQPGPVGAKSEIGGVAKAQYAGEAEQHIEAHGGQSEHQHLAGERGIAAEERQPEHQQLEAVGAILHRVLDRALHEPPGGVADRRSGFDRSRKCRTDGVGGGACCLDVAGGYDRMRGDW